MFWLFLLCFLQQFYLNFNYYSICGFPCLCIVYFEIFKIVYVWADNTIYNTFILQYNVVMQYGITQ